MIQGDLSLHGSLPKAYSFLLTSQEGQILNSARDIADGHALNAQTFRGDRWLLCTSHPPRNQHGRSEASACRSSGESGMVQSQPPRGSGAQNNRVPGQGCRGCPAGFFVYGEAELSPPL